MKKIRYIALVVLLIYMKINYGQLSMDWKHQSVGYVIEGYTSNNEFDYVWYEESNITQGVHINIIAAEKIPVFIEQNNNYICFNTFTSPDGGFEFIIKVEVNINNTGYYTIYDDNSTFSVLWENSADAFPNLGSYDLKVKIYNPLKATLIYREYEIKVIPKSDKLFKDNFGNSLRLWKGNNYGNNIPVIFSEGFDAYDTNPQQMYYYAASDLISCMRDNGFDIFLLDNKYGTQDIRKNATGFMTAVRYISELYDNTLVIAGGVSMGGVIARYALAKAADIGNPLPVYTFISIDSPQQGAVISETL